MAHIVRIVLNLIRVRHTCIGAHTILVYARVGHADENLKMTHLWTVQ